MNLIVSILMAVRSLTFVASFVSTDSSMASFTQPQIIVEQQDARVSLALRNGFPIELKKLAATGTPIPLYLYADLMAVGDNEPKNRAIAENRIQYDPVSKNFRIQRSYYADTLMFSNLDSAVMAVSSFDRFPIFPLSKIKSAETYYLNIYAVLGKAIVEALGNNSMDLMYYWNFKRPFIRTSQYQGSQFLNLTGK